MKSRLLKVCSWVLVMVMLINLTPAQVIALETQQNDSVVTTDDTQSMETATESTEDASILMEIEEKRTEFSKEYKLSNGLNMLIVYPEAVHYEKNGKWEDIDSTLKITTDGHYATTEGAWQAKFPQELRDGAEVTISRDDYSVSFGMAGELKAGGVSKEGIVTYSLQDKAGSADVMTVSEARHSRGEVRKFDYSKEKQRVEHPEIIREKLRSRMSYESVYDNTDIIYDVNSYQVKESIVINEYDASLRGYRYTLDTGSLVPVLNDDGSIDLIDATTRETVMEMPAPYMIDNNGMVSLDVGVSLKQSGSEYILIYEIPVEWMAAEERAWPVILDPLVIAKTTAKTMDDRTVTSTGTTANSDGSIMCGYTTYASWGKMRTYIKYDQLPEMTSADIVINATLSLYVCGGKASTPTTVEVHDVTGEWNADNLTWSNQPTYSSTIVDYAVVDAIGERFSWDITESIRSWYEGEKNGIVLKVSDSVENGGTANWKQFYSVNYSVAENDRGYLQYLSIIYRNSNGLENYWDYTTTSAGRAGTGYVNNFTGNLTWVHNDIGFGGNRMPVSISHIYNANDSGTNKYGLGYGWKTNYHQTVEEITNPDNVEYSSAGYVWTDGDGTKHYFVYDSEDKKYKDEDGLELTLTLSSSGYTITDKNGNTSNFDSKGRLTSMVNNQETPSSITISYTGTTGYSISQITDGAGRKYNFTYSNNLLSKISYTSTGSTELAYVSFTYSNSTLTRITDRDGEYSGFTYSSKLLTKATDIDGYNVRYSYCSGTPKRVVGITEYDGAVQGGSLSIEYADHQTTFTDHNENVQIMQFNDWGNVVSVQDDQGRAQFAQYAVNSYDDTSGKGNQLRLSSKLQNSVGSRFNNSSFEAGSSFSVLSGSGSQARSTAAAYHGDRSLALTNDLVITTTDLPIVAGRTETFSAYVKTVGTTARLEFYDGTNTYVSETLPAGSGWTKLEVTYANTGSSTVRVRARVRSEGTGTTYVDCVQWEYAETASRYNLVTNGDFRTTGYWSSTSGRTSVSASAAPELCVNVYKMTGNPATQQRISQTIPVNGVKGDTFVLSGWAKGDSAPLRDNRQFGIIGTFNYTDGTKSDPFVAQFNPATDSSVNWQYSAQAMVATKAYSSITVEVAYDYNVNTVYFDGIQLYKEEFGTSYDYDDDGNIVSVTDLQKQNTSYEYTDNDLTKIIQAGNVKMTYDYDDYHNVTKATTATGLVYEFTYDAWGNNTSVSISNGTTKITSTATYSSDGNRLVSTTDALGKTTTYGYNANTNVLEYVKYPGDTDATRTEYTYDSMYRLASAAADVDSGYSLNASYTYTDDLLTKITTNSTTYTFNYGDFALPSNIKIGSRTLASYTYSDDQNKYLETLAYGNGDSVQYEYDEQGRVIEQTYEDGSTVSYEYDNNGALATITDSATGIKTTYYYDFIDRLMKYVESGGSHKHSVAYAYDNLNNMTKIIEVINGENNVTEYAYDDDNRVSSVTNDSVSKSYAYDGFGRPSTQTISSDGTTVHTDTYTYTEPSSTTTSAQIKTHTIDAANYDVTFTYTYDNNGNILSISDGIYTTTYVYDSANQLIRENNQAGGFTHTWTYDDAGNIQTRNEYAYTTGELGTAQDTTTYQYGSSSWGDLLTRVDSYTYYDTIGNPLNNDSYAYTWKNGRELATLAVSTEFAIVVQPEDVYYLTDGNVNLLVVATGAGLSYQWQWLVNGVWSNIGTDAMAVTLNTAKYAGYGIRCVVTDANGETRISNTVYLIETPIIITSQPSDWWGTEEGTAIFTVEAISSDPNLTYQWKWDNNGVWTNSGAAGATTNTISVGASGDNGTTYRCYITDSNDNTVISEPVTIHTDPIGFITQPEDCHCSPTGTATFSVEVYGTDVTYQWQWHSPSSTSWQNSGATGANTNSISLGASGDNGTVYRCVITDAAGNMAYSEPATVIPYAVTWEFEYDANGMRTYRSNGIATYEYIYNGSQLTGLSIRSKLGSGKSVMSFAYDAAGNPLSLNYNGTRYIYATNIQGDVIAILNASGTAVVTYTYDAWGTPLSIGGTMADTLGADNPLRYRGYVWDNETGLYYLQSRYYDPEVGRFINADVYASTGQGVLGSNMFAYCLNNPICGKDPTGTLTDGQIHNSVLSAIILDYMMSGYYGLSKANTMIYYNGENIWEGFGFCDLYDIWTGEVWELKKDSSSYTCTTKYAKKQLGKYVNGRLAYYGDLELSRGGDLVFGQHTYTISDDRGTYTITYWQECQGILRYSYTFEKSHTNNQQAVQKARLACIVIAAPIVVAGFCLAGTTGAAVATIPVAVAYMLAA